MYDRGPCYQEKRSRFPKRRYGAAGTEERLLIYTEILWCVENNLRPLLHFCLIDQRGDGVHSSAFDKLNSSDDSASGKALKCKTRLANFLQHPMANVCQC